MGSNPTRGLIIICFFAAASLGVVVFRLDRVWTAFRDMAAFYVAPVLLILTGCYYC